MKFGNFLREHSVHEWRVYYLDYSFLKSALKEQSERNVLPLPEFERSFHSLVESELKKVNDFFELTSSRLFSEIDILIQFLQTTSTKIANETLQMEMGRLSEEMNNLQRFVSVNTDGFIKIMKKHDRVVGQIASPWFRLRLRDQSFHRSKKKFSLLLLRFSRACSICRQAMGKEERSLDIEEGGAQGFKRQTTKYWVKTSDIMAIKTIVAQHLPIFVYQAHTGGSEPTEESALIWSCYYDNPDTMQLYEGRLKKTEGATAIRFRVYDGSSTVFVERKTHHEGWVKIDSIKERFDLPHYHVYDFTQGKYNSINYEQFLSSKGKSNQQESIKLFNAIQRQILEWRLKPAVTTRYRRTAFQIPGNASVRISLDEELTLIKEHLEYTREQPRWRRDYDSLPEEDIHRFPYAVLEVKLQTHKGVEPPDWVLNLLGSPLVEEAAHFSKFLQGSAMLLEERVKLLPKWFPLFIGRFPRKKPVVPQLKPMKKKRERKTNLQSHSSHMSHRDFWNDDDDIEEKESSALEEIQQSSSSLRSRLKRAFYYAFEFEQRGVVVDMKVEPRVSFANERTFIQWISFAIILQGIGIAFQGKGAGGGFERFIGDVYVILSFAVILYTFANYRLRAIRITNHQPGNYFDHFGPLFLAVAIGCSFLLHVILLVLHKTDQ